MKLSKRDPGPLWLSVGATVASLALSVGPNWRGRCDASLAVLTAPLMTIVWTTFFTCCGLHPLSAANVRFFLAAENIDRSRPTCMPVSRSRP